MANIAVTFMGPSPQILDTTITFSVPVNIPSWTLPTVLTYTAHRDGTGTVKIDFSRALASYGATSTAGNYAITGPSVISVGSVSFTPGNSYVVLNVTGTWATGTYTVTVAAGTAQANSDAVLNTADAVTFYNVAGGGGGASGTGARFNPGFN